MDEKSELKVFTVEEANRLLPQLTELITAVQAKQRELLVKEVEIDALELLHPAENGKLSPEVARQTEIYQQGIDGFYALIDRIHGWGCFLKDIDMGLVDFYTLHEGRVVYLCWKMGEEEINAWHEIGRGYAYRQPIAQNHERESSG